MNNSIFNIFKIAIGPSSSHTLGPIVSSNRFIQEIKKKNLLKKIKKIKIVLYGSLCATGIGHASHKAVLIGLSGQEAQNIDTKQMDNIVKDIKNTNKLSLIDNISIDFNYEKDLLFNNKFLEYHPNAIKIIAYNNENEKLLSKVYYSIGGGFVISEDEINNQIKEKNLIPYKFTNAKELMNLCKTNSMSISQIIFENEKVFHSEEQIKNSLNDIWSVMKECVTNGCKNEGIMPGSLKIKRRAHDLFIQINKKNSSKIKDGLGAMDWLNLFALAVNEENACSGRIVTAPTNGAAGIIPAVLHYALKFLDINEDMVHKFLLTSGAIAMLYQKNASISGADVGCQGEVGVACSMAAGALVDIMGGSLEQIENAAEIAMEHNLGLTCDPIGGYVQIPCIERNAMASVKAVNAAHLALNSDGEHYVCLDDVIKTMYITGKDMSNKYKETSLGGLAVNAIEC